MIGKWETRVGQLLKHLIWDSFQVQFELRIARSVQLISDKILMDVLHRQQAHLTAQNVGQRLDFERFADCEQAGHSVTVVANPVSRQDLVELDRSEQANLGARDLDVLVVGTRRHVGPLLVSAKVCEVFLQKHWQDTLKWLVEWLLCKVLSARLFFQSWGNFFRMTEKSSQFGHNALFGHTKYPETKDEKGFKPYRTNDRNASSKKENCFSRRWSFAKMYMQYWKNRGNSKFLSSCLSKCCF